MGAAGIPSAGMVTLIVVLQAVNLPLEPVALLLSFDRFLDTFRTAMNVTGDMVGCVVVGKSWGQKKF
jgi:Na+/H+-dicarboxylate symporter